jgi:large subunit ribosomal protein L15
MLDQLSPNPGSRRKRKRVGRGAGSGSGKTCGRGQKGYGARSGSKRRAWYEGGQMPLARRLPKRGFTNVFRRDYQVVNVQSLSHLSGDDEVDATALAAAGLVASADRRVKVLGEGEITGAVKLAVHAVSDAARKKIEAAGGSVRLVESSRSKPATKWRNTQS